MNNDIWNDIGVYMSILIMASKKWKIEKKEAKKKIPQILDHSLDFKMENSVDKVKTILSIASVTWNISEEKLNSTCNEVIEDGIKLYNKIEREKKGEEKINYYIG